MQAVANDQVSVNPLTMINSEVRESLFQMSQAFTTQDKSITTQTNREVVPRENQHASTMSSRLRDFTRMNPPIYLGLKFDEDP